MSRLPPFDVVVWVKKTDDFPELRDALIGLAVAEPDESTERNGTVDFRWRFDSRDEADSVAEALTVLCQRPELVLLRVLNSDDSVAVTFKDERDARR